MNRVILASSPTWSLPRLSISFSITPNLLGVEMGAVGE